MISDDACVSRTGSCFRVDRNAADFQHLIVAPHYRHDPPVAYVGMPVIAYGGFATPSRRVLEDHPLPVTVLEDDRCSFPGNEFNILPKNFERSFLSKGKPITFLTKSEPHTPKENVELSAMSTYKSKISAKEFDTGTTMKYEPTTSTSKPKQRVQQQEIATNTPSKSQVETFSKKVETGILPKNEKVNLGIGSEKSELHVLSNNKFKLFPKEVETQLWTKKSGSTVFLEHLKLDTVHKDANDSKVARNKGVESVILPKQKPVIVPKNNETGVQLENPGLDVIFKNNSKISLKKCKPGVLPSNMEPATLQEKVRTGRHSKCHLKTFSKKVDTRSLQRKKSIVFPKKPKIGILVDKARMEVAEARGLPTKCASAARPEDGPGVFLSERSDPTPLQDDDGYGPAVVTFLAERLAEMLDACGRASEIVESVVDIVAEASAWGGRQAST